MTPVEWAIRPLRKYAVFTGRAPRAEYWWFYLASIIVGFIADFLEKLAGVSSMALIINLAILVPSLAVTVRRLHDTDRSGWWLVLMLVPFGFVGLFAGLGAAGAANPLDAFSGLIWPLVIAGIVFVVAGITLLVWLVTAGTEGSNSYGPDPYGPDNLGEVFA